MQYALIYYETRAENARRTGPDADAYWSSWSAYMDMVRDTGVLQGGRALHPGQGTTVTKSPDGGRVVEDGPFADTHDELGGFVIVEVADLDAALALAEAAPCASAGRVEVHPVRQMDMQENAA